MVIHTLQNLTQHKHSILHTNICTLQIHETIQKFKKQPTYSIYIFKILDKLTEWNILHSTYYINYERTLALDSRLYQVTRTLQWNSCFILLLKTTQDQWSGVVSSNRITTPDNYWTTFNKPILLNDLERFFEIRDRFTQFFDCILWLDRALNPMRNVRSWFI